MIEAHLSSVARARLPKPLDACAKGNGAEGNISAGIALGVSLTGTQLSPQLAVKRYPSFSFLNIALEGEISPYLQSDSAGSSF